MLVVIPLLDIEDTSFAEHGYRLPKPLVKLLGKPLFYYVIANLNPEKVHYFLIPYNEALTQYRFEDGIRHAFPNRRFIFLPCAAPTSSNQNNANSKGGVRSGRTSPAPVLEAVLRILQVYEQRVAAIRNRGNTGKELDDGMNINQAANGLNKSGKKGSNEELSGMAGPSPGSKSRPGGSPTLHHLQDPSSPRVTGWNTSVDASMLAPEDTPVLFLEPDGYYDLLSEKIGGTFDVVAKWGGRNVVFCQKVVHDVLMSSTGVGDARREVRSAGLGDYFGEETSQSMQGMQRQVSGSKGTGAISGSDGSSPLNSQPPGGSPATLSNNPSTTTRLGIATGQDLPAGLKAPRWHCTVSEDEIDDLTLASSEYMNTGAYGFQSLWRLKSTLADLLRDLNERAAQIESENRAKERQQRLANQANDVSENEGDKKVQIKDTNGKIGSSTTNGVGNNSSKTSIGGGGLFSHPRAPQPSIALVAKRMIRESAIIRNAMNNTRDTSAEDQLYGLSGSTGLEKSSNAFRPIVHHAEMYVSLTTPLALRIFYNNMPRISMKAGSLQEAMAPRRICFDLDNTLVTYPAVPGDYSTVEPIAWNIRFAQYLKRLGNTIIIHTSRTQEGGFAGSGPVGGPGAAMAKNVGIITFETIAKYEIPCDEIYFGKPSADFYVDDAAVSAFENLEQAMGFFESKNTVEARDFNSISDLSIELIKKQSEKPLTGEIHWYTNVPQQVKDMFPFMFKADMEKFRWYLVEKVNGVPSSSLLVDGSLSLPQVGAIIDSLRRLHTLPANTREFHPVTGEEINSEKLDLYANYAAKLRNRWKNHERIRNMKCSRELAAWTSRSWTTANSTDGTTGDRGSFLYQPFFLQANSTDGTTGDRGSSGTEDRRFWTAEEEYSLLLDYFEDYARKKKGKLGVMHGDPVFTNVLINSQGKLKFIDMRGSLGGESNITIKGDIFYDYGKVYQSLLGYDLILQGRFDYNNNFLNTASNEYLAHFESVFLHKHKMGREALINVKFITKMLLFSLIPLHDTKELEECGDPARIEDVRRKCQKFFELGVQLNPFEAVVPEGGS